MTENYKAVFLYLTFPLLLLVGFLLFVKIDNFFFGDKNRITNLLETDLPASPTDVDYYYSSGWDGPNGSLCARIPKEDFQTTIQKLQAEGELRKINLTSFEEGNNIKIFVDPIELKRGLRCWNPTTADNSDTYLLKTPDHDRVYIRYEQGKIFVVRTSA